MKFLKLHIVLVLFLISGALQAQNIWQKTYSSDNFDYGRAITNTYGNGFVVAGATSSWGSGTTDIYLLKLDLDGNLLWSKTFGGTNIEWAYDVIELPDSSLFVTGYTNSKGAGGYDAYLMRLDSLGNTIWDTTFGGTDWDFAYASVMTSDTTVAVAGETYSKGAGSADGWVMHVSIDGELLWDNTYGGTAHDDFQDINLLIGGDFIVTGGTNSYGAGGEDLYLLRLNNIGAVVWEDAFGGPEDDFGNVAFQAKDTNIVVHGGNSSNTGEPQSWSFMQHRDNTSTLWERFEGGGGTDVGTAAIQYYWSPGLIFAGNTESFGFGVPGDIYKSYRTETGIFINSSSIGDLDLDEVEMAITTPDSGVVFVGSTNSYGVNYSSVYVIKFDDNCNTALLPDNVIDVNDIPENLELSATFLYPNPVSSNGTLQLGALYEPGKKHEIVWYDITGRELDRFEITANEFKINNQLPQGHLLYHFYQDGELVNRGRIIVEE